MISHHNVWSSIMLYSHQMCFAGQISACCLSFDKSNLLLDASASEQPPTIFWTSFDPTSWKIQ